MLNTIQAQDKSDKSKWPLALSIVLLLALLGAYFFIPEVKAFFNEAWSVLTSDDESRIKSWVDGFGWFGPALLVLAMIAQMFLLVVPTILLMIVSILAYGPEGGSIIILVAVFAASSVGYMIGSSVSHSLLARIIGKGAENKIMEFLDKYGFWAIIVTRINPFLSNDAISFVAGLLRMSYWKFIAASLVGIAPLTVYLAAMGQSTASLKTGLLWGSLVSLVIFGLYVWQDKK
ncbi:TVP38/TMEM64 family protein [Oceanisphaera avium]|uniref:TVP38/TMEM64 family membrane protein n=1 Tax=Oceanisphaera avium TaxID=1903694 RepID=A0A1Y0CYH9_9GAMM|nr:TVP38/TMEM64 family protein [Oceanisphaera avium]ART80383.1 hypothetical protein CBP12_09695 [Oceanisphaera avium]